MKPREGLIKDLEAKAHQIRIHILKMIGTKGPGHLGGSLSAADIITVLYFYQMRHNPKDPRWEDRDRFVLSKGHSVPALYAALAETGYFPVEELATLKQLGSRLQGHPDMTKTPGLEASTGSLGQGLSIANGIALGARIDKKDYHVYVLIGDGEANEGQIWEAAMTSAKYKLDNLTAIMDRNRFQAMGPLEKGMPIDPVADKWKAFGWHPIEIDGHKIEALIDAFDEALKVKGKPTIIIANTIKGKGVSFFENQPQFHNYPLTKEEYERALAELEGKVIK